MCVCVCFIDCDKCSNHPAKKSNALLAASLP